MTVSANSPMSHVNQGWEEFTLNTIEYICREKVFVIFVLWGKHAQQFHSLIKRYGHYVIESVHPSPLSAYRGFFGSKPFSTINNILKENGETPIDWRTYV